MGLFGSIASSVAGNLVGGWLGMEGQESANEASAASARERMNWEKMMSDTAYQRGVKDLKKAGLSPMLAYSQGGASTPSGAQYEAKNELSPLASSAGSAVQKALEAGNLKAQIDKTEAETELASAQAAETQARIPTYAADIGLKESQTAKASYEMQNLLSQTNLNNTQVAKVYEEMKNLFEQRGLTQAQVEESLSRTALNREQIKEIAPRIMETYARTRRTDVETQAGEALLPFNELKGDIANRLNLPKIFREAQQGNSSAGSFGTWLYDFLHPSDEERNNRRIFNGRDYR